MNETIETLFAALVPLMKGINGNIIEINYNGCGDQGSAEFENIQDSKGKLVDSDLYENLTAQVPETKSVWNEKEKAWIKLSSMADKTLQEIAEEITYNMLYANTCGWEINAGSFGGVTITINPPKITLNHNPEEDIEDEDGNY